MNYVNAETMRDIVIIGAGGHGKEIAQLIKDINRVSPRWNLLGFLDDNPDKTDAVLGGYRVLGTTDWLEREAAQTIHAVVAIGSSRTRQSVVERLRHRFPSLRFPSLVHPMAVIGDHTAIGEGTIVGALCFISTDVKIGEQVLIHYGCTVGHDCVIERYSSILPGCKVSGNVTIRETADVGANSTVLPGIEIGARTIVGAGAVVTKPLPALCTAVGVPARPIKFQDMA